MITYKVSGKVMVEEESRDPEYWERHAYHGRMPQIEEDGFLCYKVTAGLYIFYITRAVYEEGVREGLIEPADDNTSVIDFFHMRGSRGLTVFYRISYALEYSTIDYLRSELERINREPMIVTVRHYDADWWDGKERRESPILTLIDEVKVDLENRTILKNTADKNAPLGRMMPAFRHVESYEELLDELVSEQDRSYMNSRHIIDKFAEADFYNTDHFLTQQDKFEFFYEDEEGKEVEWILHKWHDL